MPVNFATYNPRLSPVHGVDARVKIVLVAVYSVCLFCVHTWWALAALMALAFACAVAAKLDLARAARMLAPVGFILAITLAANSFVLDVRNYAQLAVTWPVSSGVFAGAEPIPLVGAFGFVPDGFARGCYYVCRIIALLVASLVLTTTSTATEITQALESFLHPLARLGLPTQDLAMIVSIALRFIPVTVDEFQLIRCAQSARGAQFDTGGLFARLRTWAVVLVPLFVGLYRRADTLASAMDARCYGFSSQRTSLASRAFGFQAAGLLALGCAVCVVIAILG